MRLHPQRSLWSGLQSGLRRCWDALLPDRASDATTLLKAARAAAAAGNATRARLLLRRSAESGSATGTLIAGCFALACEIDCAGDIAPRLHAHLSGPEPSLTPGQAARIAFLARDRDRVLAVVAAQLALRSTELHLGKRGQLEVLLREWKAEHASLPAPLVRASAAVGPEEPTPVVRIATPSIERPPTDSTAALPTPRRNIARESASSADRDPNAIALATAAEPAPAPGAKLVDAVPIDVGEFAIRLERSGGQVADLDYQEIDAVSVAAVEDLAPRPVILIDLVLNWTHHGEKPLQIVRLRSDRYAVARLMPEASGSIDALRRLLEQLLYRSAAVQLPDPSGARGRPFRHYSDLASYEREVLQLMS